MPLVIPVGMIRVGMIGSALKLTAACMASMHMVMGTSQRKGRSTRKIGRFPAGALVAQARERAGMSQEALARVLEMNQSAVSNWERGRSRPQAHRRTAIEQLLGVPSEAWLTTAEKRALRRVGAPARAA